ncbi:sodium/potassium/calcium exchanger 3-like, partial [Stegodyphus dumicola]|uniref:sodium/potassium/calcium exchanger 3-like n=1 Tax=Stegodyphus dumicola TaxID=202533 RepID=UPI0015AB2409
MSVKRRRLLDDMDRKDFTYQPNGGIDIDEATHEYKDYLDTVPSMRPPLPVTQSTQIIPISEESSDIDAEIPKESIQLSSTAESKIKPHPSETPIHKPSLNADTLEEKNEHKLPINKETSHDKNKQAVKPTVSVTESKQSQEVIHHKEHIPEEEIDNHHVVIVTTARPRKGSGNPNLWHKLGGKVQLPQRPASTSTQNSNISIPTAVPIEEDCTTPAYHEFPPDLFTHEQRAHGAVIIHIAVIVYMFYAVAVVCDDYFVASLEECCSRLNLSEDVAGATFMAAGSSAPELFTAILGVLVAKGDVGTGTIVGSAVFNVLFVIGVCGIFAGRVVELTWWPLFRDSLFYSVTVIILIGIIFDSEVTWYESVIMMVIYGLYIVLMKFNNDVHFWISRRLGIEDDMTQNIGILAQGDKKNYSSYVPFNNEIDECASMPVTAHFSIRPLPADESIRNSNRLMSIYDAALVIMMKHHFRPKTRFRAAAVRIIIE